MVQCQRLSELHDGIWGVAICTNGTRLLFTYLRSIWLISNAANGSRCNDRSTCYRNNVRWAKQLLGVRSSSMPRTLPIALLDFLLSTNLLMFVTRYLKALTAEYCSHIRSEEHTSELQSLMR